MHQHPSVQASSTAQKSKRHHQVAFVFLYRSHKFGLTTSKEDRLKSDFWSVSLFKKSKLLNLKTSSNLSLRLSLRSLLLRCWLLSKWLLSNWSLLWLSLRVGLQEKDTGCPLGFASTKGHFLKTLKKHGIPRVLSTNLRNCGSKIFGSLFFIFCFSLVSPQKAP